MTRILRPGPATPLVALALLVPALMSAKPAPSLAARMHETWAHATSARDRVVAGDLAGAQAAGGALSQVGPDAEFPASWRPGAEAVRGVALELATAKDLPAAAVAVGKLGQQCASCHVATNGGPDLEASENLPAQSFSPGDNMRLHNWASSWMWLGLIGPSDTAWSRGATALDDQPLDLRWGEKPPDHGREQLEQLVYVIAGKAAETEELPARAELYGQLVATCAQCHTTAPSAPTAPTGPK